MKRIHYAWIQQILSFDSAEERAAYIDLQEQKAARKKQTVQVLKQWFEMNEKRYYLIIRKPYNYNTMPET